MKTLKFTYTKENGQQSERVLYLTKEPGTLFSGVDLSELDINSQANFIKEMQDAKEIYDEMVAQIHAEFDTKHRYRNFIPARMTNITPLAV